MPEDQRRRQQPVAQQGLRAVDVGRDGVQQPRALPQAAPEPLPLLRRHDQREDVEAPRTLQPVGRVDVVGDAVLVDLTGDALLRLGQVLRVQLGRRGEFRPRLAQRAVARSAPRRNARRARRSPATAEGLSRQVRRSSV